jgi:hypothetical protein
MRPGLCSRMAGMELDGTARAFGDRGGAAGTGIRGSRRSHSCRQAEFSIVRLAGDSILRCWSIAHRSRWCTGPTHSAPRMFTRGVRDRTTLCIATTHMAFTRDQEPHEERSTLARLEALGADLAGPTAAVEVDSTAVEGFTAEEVLRAVQEVTNS